MITAVLNGRRLVTILLAALLGACGGVRLAAPLGDMVPDQAAFAAELRGATQPATPERIFFAWTLDEQGSRVRGRGIVRAEAPERLRLDLFGPRDETYLMAALVADEYRLPPSAGSAPLPSPTLLWAAMGVLEPPASATLTAATSTAATAELRYRSPEGDQFVYSFARTGDGPYRLERVQRARGDDVLETVAIDRPGSGQPRTQYRDWSRYRDLTLEVDSIRPSQSFPPNIWTPDVPTR
jgi:hypothetical protein